MALIATAGTPSVHTWTGNALPRRRGRRRYTLDPVVCSKRELRGSRHLAGAALFATAGTPSVHSLDGEDAVGTLPRRRGRRRYTHDGQSPLRSGGQNAPIRNLEFSPVGMTEIGILGTIDIEYGISGKYLEWGYI